MPDYKTIEDYADQLIRKYSKDISLDISELKKSRIDKKAKVTAERRNPFKFLDPYTIEDRDIFFGRELEMRELYYRVFSSTVTVVFGESGVGKTSLLQCGLFSRLKKERVEYFTIRSAVNPLESLKSELLKRLKKPHDLIDPIDILKEASNRLRRTIILVFDQFEEIFILQKPEVRIELAKTFKKVLNLGLDVKIIFTIREEYFARLVEFERVVPYILENKVWVRKMSAQTAEEAVKNACQVCHFEIEEKLLSSIFSELSKESKDIELPLMQVVMDDLYSRAVEIDKVNPRINYMDYMKIGGSKNIFSNFIENQLFQSYEPEKAKQVLNSLVTPGGTRRMVSFKDLENLSQTYSEPIEEKKLRSIINQLIDMRIIREDPKSHQIELRHDILAAAIKPMMQEHAKVLPFKESHAFIIGINNYVYLPNLRTAVNDAKKIAEVLAKEQGFKVHTPLLNACRADISQLLEMTMPGIVNEDDRCLLYFAGHGIAEKREEISDGYLIPTDAVHDDVSSYYSMKDLYAAINKLPCKHFLLILDCCFFSAFKWSIRSRQIHSFMPSRIFKERFDRFVKDPAWQVITSSAYDQSALDVLQEKPIGKRDDENMLHSPFAQALIKGLEGAADILPVEGGDGLITASELYLYIREQVEPQTIEMDEDKRHTPGIFSLERHDKGQYIFLHPKHPLNLPPIPKRNPYKGFQSFEEEDMDLFYGRERVINELIQKVDENNLIVVTGASGIGKSSVVKAGLLPYLRQQGYQIPPVMRPGKTPSAALEKVLNESKIFAGDVSLATQMEAVSEKLTMHKTVLVIDQYEELITQCQKEARDGFIEILTCLLEKNQRYLLKIILTVRADFEPQFDGTGLEKYWKNSRYPVPSFTAEELREVIIKPVLQEVLYIEPPGLVDRMIDEVIQAPGALPLLSFTLSELYRLYVESGRTDRVLHEDDYNKLGGVVGGLRTRADDLYNNMQPEYQATLQKIMLRMVYFEGGELTGKKVLMEELVFSEEENYRVITIIDQLLEARLLMKDIDADGNMYIEPAHDALIRAWATLWNWIHSHGEDRILLQNRLSEAVKDYSAIKDKSLLWDEDPRLEFFNKELQSPNSWLNKNEVIFVKESIKLKGQKRSRFITTLLCIIIVLIGLSFSTIYKANEATTKAKISRANFLTSQAQLKLKDDQTAAIRLAEESYRLNKNNIASQVLSAAAAETLEHPFYNANMQHNHYVNSAIFSPDGNMILTTSSDKTAKLWDLHGNCLAIFKHAAEVYSARFSPDSSKILTVSMDNTAKLWDLIGNLMVNYLHNDMVNSAVFSPDGSKILTASRDNTVRLWDLHGNLLADFRGHIGMVTSPVFSPDGSKILTASRDNTVRLWDLHGNLIANFRGHIDLVTSPVFSPDGSKILTASRDYTAKLWNLHGNLLADFRGHIDLVTSPVFSPDGSKILTASRDNTVRLWDLHGNLIADFKGHTDMVTSAVFSPNGSKILTASGDYTAKLWDLHGNLITDFKGHADMVTSAVFSPDGSKILTASRDKTVKLWDLRDQPVTDFKHGAAVTSALFSPQGTRIITISNDKTVKLWDLHGNITANLNGHTKMINSAGFSSDGTKIITASADNTAKMWNINGKLLKNFMHTANVNSALFSPDSGLILTASFDNTAKLWDLQGNILQSYEHRKGVIAAVFSPDGARILTASYDGTAKLWDLQGNLLKDLNINSSQVDAAIFSPDGAKVLTVSTVPRLWDINGKLIAKFHLITFREKMKIEKSYNIKSAVFSPDSKKVLTASNYNQAELWDLQGHCLTAFWHRGFVYSANFSPDGTKILTASADGTAKMWDLFGNLLADFNVHKGIVYSAVFSPDGTRVLTASADNTAILQYTPEGLIQWLKTAILPRLSLEEMKKYEIQY